MFLHSLFLKPSNFQKFTLLHALIQPDTYLLYEEYECERKQLWMLKPEMWWEGSRLCHRAVFKIWSSKVFSIFHSHCSCICRMWSSCWISASFCAAVTISVLAEILAWGHFSSPNPPQKKKKPNIWADRTAFPILFLHWSFRLGGGKVEGDLPCLKSVLNLIAKVQSPLAIWKL